MSRPAWMEQALCATEPGPTFDQDPTATQVATCVKCPVRAECLAYALEHETTVHLAASKAVSVWGGLTVKQRRKLLRDRTPAAA